jgi:hypothetical protein
VAGKTLAILTCVKLPLLVTNATTLAVPFGCVSIVPSITPCSPLKVNQRFGETYGLYLQGGKNKPHAFMLVSCSDYIIDREDGAIMFLRNIG